MRRSWALLCLWLAAGCAVAAPPTLTGSRPLVINHRGASGYLPEESIEAYRLALAMGADFIEGDVYLTADNVPVMLHDGSLNATTDVVAYAATRPEIAALRAEDGSYPVSRFTLAQLQKLRLTCRAAPGYCTNPRYDDPAASYHLATYRAFLDLAYDHYRKTGVAVGVYPEAKQSGTAVVDAILAGLNNPAYGAHFTTPGRAYTQSFDRAQVAQLKAQSSIKVVYLGVCPASADEAAAIVAIADGVGPSIRRATAACIATAHRAGLFVHPYTYLDDPAQYRTAYALGVDGVFTNFADIAIAARDRMFPFAKAP